MQYMGIIIILHDDNISVVIVCDYNRVVVIKLDVSYIRLINVVKFKSKLKSIKPIRRMPVYSPSTRSSSCGSCRHSVLFNY